MRNLILNSLFQKQGRFTTLMASLSNDVNHSKKNELIVLKRERIIYTKLGNQKILERMHVSTLFNILAQNPQLNFLNQMVNSQQQEIKRIIVSSILTTVMGQNFNIFSCFKDRVNTTNDLKDSLCQFILNGLVHACDISNYMIEVGFIYKMVILLTKEFQDQVYQSFILDFKRGSKKIGCNNNAEIQDKITFYYSETFFLNTFVLPQSQMIAALKTSFLDLPREVKRSLEILEEEKKKISN